MTNKILSSILIFLLFFNDGFFSQPPRCANIFAKEGSKFKRTFTQSKTINKKISKKNSSKKNNEDVIEVSYDDFLDHIALDKQRTVYRSPSSIIMNIGKIDPGYNETWVMPNLSSVNAVPSQINHITLEETEISDAFPDDATHGFFIENANRTEVYSLNEYDLFFYGYGEMVDGVREPTDFFVTTAPVPLNNYEAYEGTVTYIYENPTEQEMDSIQFIDIYYPIGQGTLSTFDDGDSEAIKLIYTEEYREFKNGVVLYFETSDQIVFYSKKGHHFRADIDNPWSSEGEVILRDIIYQKIESKTASTTSFLSNKAHSVFPNPITSGEILKIKSENIEDAAVVELINIQGQKVGRVNLLKNKANQFEIQVPELISSGLYIYRVFNKDNNLLHYGKLQIK